MKDEDKFFKMFMELLSVMSKLIDTTFEEEAETNKVKTKEERHATFERVYKKLEDNWILDGDVLLGLLKYYIDIRDIEKCYKIVYVLVRHYREKINVVYDIWAKDEDYEKCQRLKMMINSIPNK